MPRRGGTLRRLAAAAAAAARGSAGLDNGLAQRPPMGWNSWNHFACAVNETVIRATADALSARGYAAAGYEYVNIDDCWMSTKRDKHGDLQADPALFPSGMKALADYVHGKGLKFGIYLSSGTKTCSKKDPHNHSAEGWGSFGFEARDAAWIAAVGADYLKYDGVCSVPPAPAGVRTMDWEKTLVSRMGVALNATGRPIWYQYGAPYTWKGWDVDWVTQPNASDGGLNSYRSSFDMGDNWGLVVEQINGGWGLRHWAWKRLSRPGSWADYDVLEIGNGRLNATSGQGLNTVQSKTYFSWWAVANAPLLMGADLTGMPADLAAIQQNGEVIQINQDYAGDVGQPLASPLSRYGAVWGKRLSAAVGGGAAAFFYCPVQGQQVTVFFADLGFGSTDRVTLRDVSTHTDLGEHVGSYTSPSGMQQDDSMLLRITRVA